MEVPQVKPFAVVLLKDFFRNYRLSRGPVLGSGMSGEVVLATSKIDPSLKRAVKILSLLTEDGGIRNERLFTKEVTVLQRLSHPHVIKHSISARCPGYLVICTHYCPNGTLTSKIDNITIDLCAKYFVQMTCVVRYLSEKQRTVHGDIKPDNIFINANNDAVLGDFGLSRLIPPGDTMIPTEYIGGTKIYRAPELDCRTLVDPYKLDMYSLGVVLWCMLFKKEPTSDKVHQILNDAHLLFTMPEPQGWCLVNSVQTDPDKRRSAASILTNLHSAGIYKSLIDSLATLSYDPWS